MLVVRTQDKQNTVTCMAYGLSNGNNGWYVTGKMINNNEDQWWILGKYRSKKRCFEILDEMDKAHEKQMSKCNTRVVDINGYTISNSLTNHYFEIYKMPKK